MRGLNEDFFFECLDRFKGLICYEEESALSLIRWGKVKVKFYLREMLKDSE